MGCHGKKKGMAPMAPSLPRGSIRYFSSILARDVEKDANKYASKIDVTKGHLVWNEDNILSGHELECLQTILDYIVAERQVSIVVYVIRDYRGLAPSAKDELEALTTALYQASFRKDVEDGLILAYFQSQRAVRTNAGPAVATTLTQTVSEHIQREYMVPHFRNNQIAAGLLNGLRQIITTLDHRSSTNPPKNNQPKNDPPKNDDQPKNDQQSPSDQKSSSTTNPPEKRRGWWSGWWSDFKAWNRAMLKGERSVGVTALYGAGVGATAYYGWQALKWLFWTGVASFVLWKIWKWIKHHYFPPPTTVPAPTPPPIQETNNTSKTSDGPTQGTNNASKTSDGVHVSSKHSLDSSRIRPGPVVFDPRVIVYDDDVHDDLPFGGYYRAPGLRPTTDPTHADTTHVPVVEPETKVPAVAKAAATGAAIAVVNRDFQQFRAEQRQKEEHQKESNAKSGHRKASSGSSWDGKSSSSSSSYNYGSSSDGKSSSSGSSYNYGSSSDGKSSSSGSSYDYGSRSDINSSSSGSSYDYGSRSDGKSSSSSGSTYGSGSSSGSSWGGSSSSSGTSTSSSGSSSGSSW